MVAAPTALRPWLEELGEEQHAATFEGQGHATVEELLATGLEEKDLADLGLRMKSRRRLTKALRSFASSAAGDAVALPRAHGSPLTGGVAARGASTEATARTWPKPSALRRYLDPSDGPPPGRSTGTWDISGVPHPGGRLRVVSSDPLIQQWDGFFSEEETAALIEAMMDREGLGASGNESWMGPWINTAYKYAAHGDATLNRKYLHPTLADATRSAAAAALLGAEEKLAAWSGVHWEDLTGFQLRDESPLVSHRTAAGKVVAAPDSEPPCSPVHIDNHKAPARIATSIVYLTTLGSGATVFPCVLPEGTKRSVVRARRRQCKAAAQATNYDHTHGDPHGLLGLAGSVCNGTAEGLSVLPEAGKAILFYTKENQIPNYLLWHAGCHVNGQPAQERREVSTINTDGQFGTEWSGSTHVVGRDSERKITIQKFKEAAPVIRHDKSAPAAKKMLQEDFGKEWMKGDANRNGGVSAGELTQMWDRSLAERGFTEPDSGGDWLAGDAGVSRSTMATMTAQARRVLELLDLDKDGELGLVEWTVQHSILAALLLSEPPTWPRA